jgi:hypothetical protein
MKRIIPIILLASFARAESGLESLGYVAAAFGLMSLIASYQLIYRRSGLDEQISKKAILLKRLQEETKEAQDKLNFLRKEAGEMESQAIAEIQKSTKMRGTNLEPDKLRKEYWDHLQQMGEISPDSRELRKLMVEKADLEHMVEMTKSKYLEWSMDEKSFNNIIEGYQRKIIELETKIQRLRVEKDGS